MSVLRDWANRLDVLAIEECEAGHPKRAREYAETAAAFDARQDYLDERAEPPAHPPVVKYYFDTELRARLDNIVARLEPLLAEYPQYSGAAMLIRDVLVIARGEE